MPPYLSMIAKGVALGLGAAVPIGPVNVEIARRTLRSGFPAGFALGCGAVTVDVTYAILSSLGFKFLLGRTVLYWPLLILGVGLLTYLGVMCWVSAMRLTVAEGADVAREIEQQPPRAHAAYLTGLLMTLLNPMTVAFWFLALPATAGAITQEPRRDLPMICLGVFIGTVAWVLFFAGLLSGLGRYRRSWWLALADGIGGTTLLIFAVAGFCRVCRQFL